MSHLRPYRWLKGLVAIAATASSFAVLPGVAGAASSAPLVTSFAASATTVPQTGAVVTFTGSTVRATACTLSIKPALANFPTTCPLSSFVIPVTFLPNLTKKTINYVVTVKAKKILSNIRTLKITERPAGAPIVLQWSAVRPAFTSVGPLTALSCTATSTCVAGDAVGNVFTMTSGTWAPSTTLSQSIDALSCWSTTSCLAVGANGLLASSKTGSWVTLNSHTTEELTAVSCASSTLCVAVGINGDGLVINPTTALVTLSTGLDATGTPVGVSCTTATASCLAVDDAGSAFSYNGTWGPLTNISSTAAFTAISCPLTTTCLATTDDGSVITIVSKAFSSSAAIDASGVLIALSCSSTTSCTATDDLGKAFVLSGSTWTATSSLSVDGAPAASCPSVGHCVILTPWAAIPLTGASSGTATTIEVATGTATSVSCVTTTFCEAVSTLGYATSFNGASWTKANQQASVALASVSCPSATFCMAVGDQGTTVANNFGTWTTRTLGGSPSLTSVSCVSSSFCMAVDNDDHYYLWSGSSWGSAMSGGETPDYRSFDAVSCASTTFCAMTDNTGHVVFWNGSSTFGFLLTNSNASMDGASCPSIAGCVFGDSRGSGVLFANTPLSSWKTSTIDTAAITGLSCVAANYCVAIDDQGAVLSLVSGTWGAVGASGSTGLTSGLAVSCINGPWCMALDQNSGTVVGTLKP